MIVLIITSCNIKTVESQIYEGNLVVNKSQDFEFGKMENLSVSEFGEIVLEESKTKGKYISPILPTDKFNELVASWNIDTPKDTVMELKIRIKIEEQWTDWFSYGKWSEGGIKESKSNQEDKIAKLSIDVLEVLWGKEAEYINYSIELSRKDDKVPSPKVRNIFFALKLLEDVQEVVQIDKDYLIELDVPQRSQMIVPKIGNLICSPAALSMVLEYYGHNIETEEVAAQVHDKSANIYGNWSFNVAYAGTKIKYAYVARFSSVEDIKKKISEGIPIIASIKTKSENTLIGAPQTYPNGHLIVIRGFTVKNGEEYMIVNDPAAPEVETVRREYKVSGFEKAWNKMVYILSPELN